MVIRLLIHYLHDVPNASGDELLALWQVPGLLYRYAIVVLLSVDRLVEIIKEVIIRPRKFPHFFLPRTLSLSLFRMFSFRPSAASRGRSMQIFYKKSVIFLFFYHFSQDRLFLHILLLKIRLQLDDVIIRIKQLLEELVFIYFEDDSFLTFTDTGFFVMIYLVIALKMS